jgi:hypothetical protein
MAQFDSSIIFRQTPYAGPTADELQGKQNMNALRNTLGEGYNIDDPKVVNAMMARDPDMGLKLMTNANSMRKSASDVATAEQERMTTELDRYVPLALAVAQAGDQPAWSELRGELSQVFPSLGRSLPTEVGKAGPAVQAYIDARRGLKGISSALPYQATEMGGYLQRFNRATGKMELVLDNAGNPMPSNAIRTAGIGAESRETVAGIGADVRRYGIDVGADTASQNRVAQGERQTAKAMTEAGMQGVTRGVVVAPGQQPAPDQPGVAASVPDKKRMVELQAALPKARASLSATEDKITSLDADIDSLINDPSLAKITGDELATYRGSFPTLFGPGAARAQAKLKAIIAQGVFSELADIKQQSPTGSALGSVSDKEGALLAAGFGELAQAQTAKDVVAALNKIKATLARSRARLRGAFDEEYGQLNTAGGAVAPAGGGVTVTTPDGASITFPDQRSADAFKKEAGLP